MANLLFKINIETEAGREVSYCDTAFATTTQANISASAILTAVNGMVSCSYTSDANAPATTLAGTFNGTKNYWLEASLVGHTNTGSIKFTHTDTLAGHATDPLKRYRFFGTKVCNVLGLPEGQWIYPQNFHLDDSGNGTNYFSGDVAASNLSLTNGFTMANTATMRSNLRYNIDKTADLFVQFTTGSGAFQSNALLLGYNSDTDKYVLDKADENNLYLDVTEVVASGKGSFARVTGSYAKMGNIFGHGTGQTSEINMQGATGLIFIESKQNRNASIYLNGWSNPGEIILNNAGVDIDTKIKGNDEDNVFVVDADTNNIGIHTNSPTVVLHLNETTNDKNGIVFDDDTSEMYLGMKNNSQKLTIGNGTTIGGGTPILTIDDANDRLGILEEYPTYTLDVGGSMGVDDYIYHNGDANTYILFGLDDISFVAGGVTFMDFNEGSTDSVIINEGGVDVNFRVETEDIDNMLKIDGGLNTVGIGTGTPFRTLHTVCDLASEYGTSTYANYGGPLWEHSRASNSKISDWITANINTAAHRYSIVGPAASDDNIYFYFRDDGAEDSQWYTNTDGSANNFTGQHTVNIVSGSSLLNIDWKGAPEDKLGISGSNVNEFVGKIVYATGDYQRWNKIKREYVSGSDAIEINEALPIVDMVSSSMDKRVFGVLSDREDRLRKDPDTGDYTNDWQMTSGSADASGSIPTPINAAFKFQNLKPGKVRVNSIGEGAIWICNISGSLENGDYITTCKVPGYGSKQNDDILHNYTVAKITTDCDFTTGNYTTGSTTHNSVIYKTAFVGCTYHCG